MNLIRQAVPTGYEKIRKYFFTQIAKSAGTPMRLSSSREIAREFGVTHTTVVRALRDLVDGGYLSVRKGVGVFTNPWRNSAEPETKVIGMFFGDGKTTMMTRIYVQHSLHFAEVLLARSTRYQVLHSFISAPPEQAAQEIAASGLDGIVWFNPCREIWGLLRTLRETTRMGIVVLGAKVPGISSLAFDLVANSREPLRQMLAMGRRRVVALCNDQPELLADVARGCREAMAEAGMTFDPTLIVIDTPETQRDFLLRLERLKADGIIFHVNINHYWSYFAADPTLLDRYLCVSGDWSLSQDMGFRGLAGYPHLHEAAEIAVDNLTAQLDHPDSAPVIEASIEMETTIKGEVQS